MTVEYAGKVTVCLKKVDRSFNGWANEFKCESSEDLR